LVAAILSRQLAALGSSAAAAVAANSREQQVVLLTIVSFVESQSVIFISIDSSCFLL